MEFEVMKPGHVQVPNFHFINEEGTNVFIENDCDPDWHRHPRPGGRYASTGWVPGNLLTEGTIIVGSAISTMAPFKVRFYERDGVAFEVVYSLDSDSARGNYAGHYPGVVRPLLRLTSRFNSNSESNSSTNVMEGT
jgi:lipopolysaccharide transport system ATP-binding protein